MYLNILNGTINPLTAERLEQNPDLLEEIGMLLQYNNFQIIAFTAVGLVETDVQNAQPHPWNLHNLILFLWE